MKLRIFLRLALGGLVIGSCGEAPSNPGTDPVSALEREGDAPTARRVTHEELQLAQALPRHASDGGGRAWIEDEGHPTPIQAGTAGTWTIVYEAGELGVATGGSVRLLVSPFWNWSEAQVRRPNAPGYTTVTCAAEGVELEVRDPRWLLATIGGRELRAGERIVFTYGAGPRQAMADSYAERGSRFWIAVDGDGDGTHAVLRDSPAIDVAPGPAARLSLVLPSTAAPGDEVTARLAVLDRTGSRGVPFEGEVELVGVPQSMDLPRKVTFTAEQLGVTTVTVKVHETGVHRFVARAQLDPNDPESEVFGEGNPLLVEAGSPRIRWGDLHGHSNLSDGTGEPEDYLAYAREVAGLDIVALTDHDHWGLVFLDENPDMWERIRALTDKNHIPDEFVTLLGYEWTSWLYGHRHVIYFGDDGPVLSSIDPNYESPLDLWKALEGHSALTFAHHSAGGPIATDWRIPPDPRFEPVTEVSSVHGSSEAEDSPWGIYNPLQGNFVRDVLDKGYKLGFIASGDSHDGHPGLAHYAGMKGGTAAILTDELTREGVRHALMKRRTYGTSGPRIILRCALDSHRMGAGIAATELPADGPSLLYVRVIGCAPLFRLDVIRSGKVIHEVPGEKAWDFAQAFELEDLEPGEYVYVRAIQEDKGTAWSSPFFIE